MLGYLLSCIKLRGFELSSLVIHISLGHILGTGMDMEMHITFMVSEHDLSTQKAIKLLCV